jgi:BirA family transcriptional regulator, biotin operon repressor / biotin---[acetyl-CoA-carboxylase] ligase
MQPATWAIERLASVGSTMDVARDRARSGAPHGTVVVAEEMTAGRGTRGNAWAAPKGGLYLSIVLRDLADPHLLTLALGNAVCDALEVAGVEPRLKWVNDVLVGGRKVAGILVEAESTGSKLDFIVAGIGMNVNGTVDAFPADVRPLATTLESELGCESCVPDLEALLLQSVERWVGKVRDGHGDEILAACRARDALRGRQVVLADGATQMVGVADGIDDKGHLRIRGPDGSVHAFASGSVRLA